MTVMSLAYVQSCSRLTITNPHAIAMLRDHSVPNLRKLAGGNHFVHDGELVEYPEKFNKKPKNPGFVNDTYGPHAGEFEASDEDESDDDEKWVYNPDT